MMACNTLVQAVEGGHMESVQFLLDRGAATDIPDGRGYTSVHTAVAVAADVPGALSSILRWVQSWGTSGILEFVQQ